MKFKVEYAEGYEDPWLVKSEEGWFFPMPTEQQAQNLCETLKELFKPKKPTTIADYYTEWEKAITEIDTKTKDLLNLKETYNQMEQDIIENTDFKELYGANNQKVRDNHVKNELKDMVEQKQTLELRIDYLKRRIDFIKSIVKAKLFTIYGVGE